MSNCQKDVKCQKIEHLNYGGGLPKKNGHNEVHRFDGNFDITFEDNQNWSKIDSMVILRVFSVPHVM